MSEDTVNLSMQSIALFQQDNFLDLICKQKYPIFIYLISGIKLKGYMAGFDKHVIFLKSESSEDVKHKQLNLQIIYKHAISTIAVAAV